MKECCRFWKFDPRFKFCPTCGKILIYTDPKRFVEVWKMTHSWDMVVAFDFDGTLSNAPYPQCGNPNVELIEFAKGLQKEGVTIKMWTCRKDKELDDAVKWCTEQGLVFDLVNESCKNAIELFGDSRKINFDYCFDDKCIRV